MIFCFVMDCKKFLYAGLIAASVGCGNKKVEEEQQKLSIEQYNLLTKQEIKGMQQELLTERERLLKEQQSTLKEREEKLGEFCVVTYNVARTVAAAADSEEMMRSLDSKEWCKVQSRYESDQQELEVMADDGARDYCKTLRLEAYRLVLANKQSLARINQHQFSCEGGYYGALNHAFDLQIIINSYRK